MGFMDALREQQNNPIGPSPGIIPMDRSSSGMGGGGDITSILSQIEPFIRKMHTLDLDDMRSQQNIMNSGNLAIRDPRTRNVMNPEPQNVIYNPGITDFQKASLGLDREKLDLARSSDAADRSLNKEKLEVAKKTGDEKLELQKGNLELDKKKNEQIYETKIKDMERKAEEANARLQLAEQQMRGRENNAMMQDQFKRAQLDAINARHELDIAQRDAAADETRRYHDAQMKDMQDKLEALQNGTVTTEVNDEGTKKTVTTSKGKPKETEMISVKAPDGRSGKWPASEPLPKGYTKVTK